MIKTFSLHFGSSNKPKILPLAPSGVAAINTDSTTFNNSLPSIQYCKFFLTKVPAMVKSKLQRDLFREVEFEVHKIPTSNVTLLHIHKRLREIFGYSEELAFASKSVAMEDLLQLQQIRASPYTLHSIVY